MKIKQSEASPLDVELPSRTLSTLFELTEFMFASEKFLQHFSPKSVSSGDVEPLEREQVGNLRDV